MTIILFPLVARTGKIRHVAAKMLERVSPRDMAHYQHRIASDLISQAERAAISRHDLDEQLQLFWSAVQRETGRLIEAQYSEGESA